MPRVTLIPLREILFVHFADIAGSSTLVITGLHFALRGGRKKKMERRAVRTTAEHLARNINVFLYPRGVYITSLARIAN